MTAHPLTLPGEAVRAILAGTKTTDRRLVTPVNSLVDGRAVGRKGLYGDPDFWSRLDWSGAYVDPGPSPAGNPGPYWKVPYSPEGSVHRIYPRIQVGDQLWVRETWALESSLGVESAEIYTPPHADGRPTLWHEDEDEGRWWEQAHYRATDPPPSLTCESERCRQCREEDCGPHWRSPVLMPKRFARLWLRIGGSAPQWLQDITEEGAIAEGVESFAIRFPRMPEQRLTSGEHALDLPHRSSFAVSWDTINGDRGPWASNPPVWAYTFSRTEAS